MPAQIEEKIMDWHLRLFGMCTVDEGKKTRGRETAFSFQTWNVVEERYARLNNYRTWISLLISNELAKNIYKC